MRTKRLFALTTLLAGLWLIAGLWPASGQQAPPAENKGVKIDSLAAIDLGPEIDGMQGRQLRLRLITIEPGGVVGLHSHKDRPTVVRVLQGTLTEHREGGGGKEYKQGDSQSEGKETTHWAENKGTTPVVLIGADVFKQQEGQRQHPPSEYASTPPSAEVYGMVVPSGPMSCPRVACRLQQTLDLPNVVSVRCIWYFSLDYHQKGPRTHEA